MDEVEVSLDDVNEFQRKKRLPGRGNALQARLSPEAKELGKDITRGIAEFTPIGTVASVGQQILSGEKEVTDALELMSEAVLGKIKGPVKVARNIIAGRGATGYAKAAAERRAYHNPLTGLGAEGKPRFEIPDTNAKIKTKPVAVSTPKGGTQFRYRETSLEDLLDHPELFENYPWLRKYSVSATINPALRYGGSGQQLSRTKTTGQITVSGFDEQGLRSSLLHEIQHAVQDYEDFARGASSDLVKRLTVDPKGAPGVKVIGPQLFRQPLYDDVKHTKPVRDFIAHGGDRFALNDDYMRYLLVQGETEARIVQERAEMTAEQLAKLPPWRHMPDVNKDKLILLMNEFSLPL